MKTQPIYHSFGSAELMRQAGKSLSLWTAKIGETTIGGQPPTFEDIDTEPEMLKEFTNRIFKGDKHNRWSSKVRELLVMSLLLRYDQFVDVLMNHPYAQMVEGLYGEEHTCSAIQDNLFISSIEEMVNEVCQPQGLSQDSKFRNWINEARKGFLSRNAPSLPIETFPLYDGDGTAFMMDTRCFTDHFNALATYTQSNHLQLQHCKHMLNDIQHTLSTERKLMSALVTDKLFNIEKSVQRLEKHLVGENKPFSPQSKGIITRFSVSSKRLPKNASLSEVTTAFFADNYHSGYTQETGSQYWNELDAQARRSIRNKLQPSSAP